MIQGFLEREVGLAILERGRRNQLPVRCEEIGLQFEFLVWRTIEAGLENIIVFPVAGVIFGGHWVIPFYRSPVPTMFIYLN